MLNLHGLVAVLHGDARLEALLVVVVLAVFTEDRQLRTTFRRQPCVRVACELSFRDIR